MTSPTFISNNKLAGTRVLVLGGTSGIGFAVARAALENGAAVIVASSRKEKVNAAVSRLREYYPGDAYADRIAGFPCDLGNEEKLEANVVALLQETTRPDLFTSSESKEKVLLDHIIFTAGDPLSLRSVMDPTMDTAYIRSISTVRLYGSAMVAKHVPTFVKKAASSSLTFTSGTNVAKPMPGFAVGAMMGAGLEGLARGLAVDLAPVRVNTVSPGAVRTELFEGFGERLDAMVEVFKGQTLTGEIGRPEDVAEAYLYLMKDRFVTGLLVESSGGRLLK